MFRWYVINTYSGHENKVKQNLEHRVSSLNQSRAVRRVQWPDRRQVGQGTAVTLGFVIVAGAYLGLLDAIWNPVIQAIL